MYPGLTLFLSIFASFHPGAPQFGSPSLLPVRSLDVHYRLCERGTGISHAIGHQLGAHCHVPHGQTSCIMLPHAMDFNRMAAADRLAPVAEAAGHEVRELSIPQAAVAAIESVRRLVKELGCPSRLRDVGVKESDFPLLAEAVMVEAPLMQNPRPIGSVSDVIEVLRKAW